MTVQAEKKRERQSGIELLRLLAGLAVIVLHFNFRAEGGGAAATATGLSQAFLIILECLCISAVNVFILISGYFSFGRESVRVKKLVLLLLQTIFFQVLAAAAAGIIDHNLSMKTMIGALLPVNYYVILYVALMLLSPFINRMMSQLDTRAAGRLVLLLLAVFSLAATGVDILKSITGAELKGLSPVGIEGSMDGYTIVNFIMVYILGAYCRKSDSREKPRTGTLLMALAGIAAALFLWYRVLPGTAWSYCNPFVIAEAYVLFLLFSRLRFRSRIINRLATATFTCFLIHGAILARMDLEAYGAMSFPALAGILALTAAGIFLASFGMAQIWNLISGPLARGKILSGKIISSSEDGKGPTDGLLS